MRPWVEGSEATKAGAVPQSIKRSQRAPGTGTPEQARLTPREVFPMLRRLAREVGIVGAGIDEMNPLVDPGYTTALVANRCLVEIIGCGDRVAGSALLRPPIREARLAGPPGRQLDS